MDESGKKMDDLPAMPIRHRREGFPGQHHVVLPSSVVAMQREHPLLRGLFVTDAGQYPRAERHLVSRSNGTEGFVLIVCTAGKGWVRSMGRKHEIGPGDTILLGPNREHAYGSADADPWTIEWTHFAGSDAEAWRHAIVGDGSVLNLHPTASIGIRLSRIHEHLEAGYDETRLLLSAAALRRSLAELVRFRRIPNQTPTSIDAVEATADWMRVNLSTQVNLSVLAKKAGMSSSRYSEIFRQRFGYPPIDWFMRQRILQACRLLDLTGEKVEVVGLEVGFRDPYYFSRSFRKVMGCSPRAYRSVAKG